MIGLGYSVSYGIRKGLVYGCVFGGIYGTGLYLVVGTIYGVFLGAIMGLILGVIDGLMLGWVMREFFNPITNKTHFRFTVYVLTTLVTYIGAVLYLCIIYNTSRDWPDFTMFQLPAMIAAAAALYAAHRLANEYISISTAYKPKSHPHLPVENV